MARRHEPEAGETLLEIQSLADSLALWLHDHWKIAAGIVGALLLVTGLGAGIYSWRDHQEMAAANALASAEREFLTSMGAEPGTSGFEEPANPETGKKARAETADKLQAIAKEHAGTSAAVHAKIEAGVLMAQAGNADQAIALWRGVLEGGDASPALQALVQVRIAQAEEGAGRWREAAKAYQEAGEQRAYPLWAWALADAARCLVEAGDRDQAIRIAERLRIDAPQVDLPPDLAGLLEELRVSPAVPPKG